MDHLPLSDIPMLVSSIASYVNAMSPALYKALSHPFLKEVIEVAGRPYGTGPQSRKLRRPKY